MTLADHLDEMRSTLPGCALVSFGDLRTGVALRTSAAHPCKQNELEALLAQAARGFALADDVAFPEDPLATSVIVATPEMLNIFVRSADCPSDLLCFRCADAAAHAPATKAAEKLFSALAEAL